jgi:hypothetical protein
MEALMILTGTLPGPDGIALWVTMKNFIQANIFFTHLNHKPIK